MQTGALSTTTENPKPPIQVSGLFVDVANKVVTIDGIPLAVSQAQALFVQRLLQAHGGRVRGRDIATHLEGLVALIQ